MKGIRFDSPRSADLKQRSGVEHIDPVAGREGEPQVVRDENEAHAAPLLHALQQLDDLGLGGDVEGGGRLVRDQEFRIARKGGGERDALTHAAGQLERHALRDVRIGDADFAEAPRHLRLQRGAVAELRPVAQHLRDMQAGFHQRVQHGEGVLQHHR